MDGLVGSPMYLKAAGKEFEYKPPYLYNTRTHAVITVQDKAWNDAVGTPMWWDTVLAPARARLGKKWFLIWDNCGPHTVPALAAVFAEHQIEVAQLPAKMTALLQVMDLVVNGPIKAAVRRARSQELFEYMQSWKSERALELAKPVAQRVLKPFQPRKPTQAGGIRIVMSSLQEMNADDSFRRGMRRTFELTGQVQDWELAAVTPGKPFHRYPGHVAAKRINGASLAVADNMLADLFSQMTFVSREEEEAMAGLRALAI